ncbi:unnamed protein product, partial [Rotaria sp. Silwood2]
DVVGCPLTSVGKSKTGVAERIKRASNAKKTSETVKKEMPSKAFTDVTTQGIVKMRR